MNIAEFLKARLDEDDQAARRATEGQWVAEYSAETGHCVIPADAQSTREFVARTQLYAAAGDAEHVARQGPARVLAEVEAKRRILHEHRQIMGPGWCTTCDVPGDVKGREAGCLTIRLLALPYADHPDYQQEWRP